MISQGKCGVLREVVYAKEDVHSLPNVLASTV